MTQNKNIKMQLSEIIDELNLINGKLFHLKQGTSQLVKGIRDGMSNEKLEKIIEIFKISETIESLTIQD